MKFYFALLGITLLTASCGNDPSSASGHAENEIGVDENGDVETAVDSNYCDCTELTLDRPYNHFWRYERNKGFTGICEEFYPNGEVKITKNFLDGKLHGKFITYYENGQIHEEKQFDMNLQVGEKFTYTKKGEIKYHALYKNGELKEVLVSKPNLVEEEAWPTN